LGRQLGAWRPKKRTKRRASLKGSTEALKAATDFRDENNNRINIVEAVAALVRAGWDAEYVVELPIDVFQEVVLVVSKQTLEQQRYLTMTIMAAAATMFTKKGQRSAFDELGDKIEEVDGFLRDIGDEDEDDEEDEEYELPVRTKRRHKSKKMSQKKKEQMFRAFHDNFRRWLRSNTGVLVPSLDSIVETQTLKYEAKLAQLKKTRGE